MSDAPPPPSSSGGDQPPQAGWWKASDGNWYPPESRPAEAPAATAQPGSGPPATPPRMSGCLKAFLIVGGIGVVLFIGVIVVIGFVINRAGEELEDVGEGLEAETAPIDPDRPDAQEEDRVVAVGGSVRLAGYTATVNSVEFREQVSDFETEGYFVANVTIENRDDRSQRYATFDWSLQTPEGQVIDPTFTSADQLGSGDLVEGGSVTGDVMWEIGAATGQFFLIYKPDPFNAARGIWPVAI